MGRYLPAGRHRWNPFAAPTSQDRGRIILVDLTDRRSTLERLFRVALAAVDPERLTREALQGARGPATVVALGKAAPGMCRAAAAALGEVGGICVTESHEAEVPEGVELVVGDHPVPGAQSFSAGRRTLETAASAKDRLIALISGGGSALCEHPLEGIPSSFISDVNARLLESGASIDEINLVRRHLSAVKNGGLARVATAPVATYVISDVCGADLSVVASGPTLPGPNNPDSAIAAMGRHGIEVPARILDVIRSQRPPAVPAGPVELLADGHAATRAMVDRATEKGLPAVHVDEWLDGPVDAVLDWFFDQAGPGLTVAAGEPEVVVTGDGSGGRNTHAALLAATKIAGTDSVFGAFATDGIDGNTRCAGAIVDGDSLQRGGDPASALNRSDSATYLEESDDLMVTGPTGTNVADIWVLWKPAGPSISNR